MIITRDHLRFLSGVYLFNIDHEIESHAFVLWIDDTLVKYYAGYGGYNKAIYVETFRERWLTIMTSETIYTADLLEIWGLPLPIAEPIYDGVDTLTLQSIRIQRIA